MKESKEASAQSNTQNRKDDGKVDKNGDPLVTIGISTFNRADGYLKYALDSAVNQTWGNLEIIVSDNCSEDKTEQLVRGYSDPRIHYIKQKKNIGAANNFNFCLSQAKGRYFLLLHDDDLIDPDFIETCMDKVVNHGDRGIVRTGTRLIDADGFIRNRKPNNSGRSNTDFLLSWFSDKTALYLCSTLYNTAGLREVGGFTSETYLFNDVAPILKLAAKYGRHDIIRIKASFRRHDENRGSMEKLDNWVRDSRYILKIIGDMDLDKKDYVIKKAQGFLSRKCYRYVKAIKSPAQRLSAYLMVYRTFGYRYSPLMYFYSSRIKRKLRWEYIKYKLGLAGSRGPQKLRLVNGSGNSKSGGGRGNNRSRLQIIRRKDYQNM